MTPWKDLGNKFASLLNDAIDDAKKEIARKKGAAVGTVTVEVKGASVMTPADVSAAVPAPAPADPHGKMRAANEEIDRLRACGDPPRLAEPEPVLSALAGGDPAELAPLLGNELQPAAVSLDPGLRRTLRAGVEAGALAGLVSGSGPTCAFLCSSEDAALDVSSRLAGAGVCRTVRVASGPVPGARVIPATDAS